MPDLLQLPGVTLERGDHVCGFYYGDEERDALLMPFLRGALASGDKCVAVVDSVPPAELLSRLEGDLDVADCVATGQLEMYDSSQTYLRTGTFEPDEMIAFWESRAQATSEEGCYPFAWVVGEMSWLDRVRPERERVVRYESWANAFAARFPQAVLCLYDLRRLGSGVLLDLIKTHPRILLGGLVLENPHHLTDDEFTAAFA
ncbi:MAG: MEDS domain-containing protein [Nocardioidaceae bacterium]